MREGDRIRYRTFHQKPQLHPVSKFPETARTVPQDGNQVFDTQACGDISHGDHNNVHYLCLRIL